LRVNKKWAEKKKSKKAEEKKYFLSVWILKTLNASSFSNKA